MKAIILAGGFGTRISEETHVKPKPMVKIGGRPILWHIMKIYASYGINDFIICLGYKGYVIKEFFANYSMHLSDVTFDLKNNLVEIHQNNTESWKVTLVDTGENTMTGGRLKRIKNYLDNNDFCFTYGDGISDINITESIEFHRSRNVLATVTAVRPPGRFGNLNIDGDTVTGLTEKPEKDGMRINGGFFILSPKVIDYIDNDEVIWEVDPLNRLAQEGNLAAYCHNGFWQPMDTLREKEYLEELWHSGNAPWKSW